MRYSVIMTARDSMSSSGVAVRTSFDMISRIGLARSAPPKRSRARVTSRSETIPSTVRPSLETTKAPTLCRAISATAAVTVASEPIVATDEPLLFSTAETCFIVDNSISGWTGLRYLREWCGIANGLDVATGFFEIGGLFELDGEWQKIQKIRILMGDEVSRRSRQALLEAVRRRAKDSLDTSIEEEKAENSFLGGVAV
jgi:hypothetical protein